MAISYGSRHPDHPDHPEGLILRSTMAKFDLDRIVEGSETERSAQSKGVCCRTFGT